MTTQERFRELETSLNGVVLERADESHTMCLSLAAHLTHFVVAPPGTGKSFHVDQLIRRVHGLELRENYFRQMITGHMPPEALFGPIDLAALDENRFEFSTAGMLPEAEVCFLDELFKATAILDSLLTLLNERLFFNGDHDPHVPLLTMFGASNEVPPAGESSAIWDRLSFRHVSRELSDEGWKILMGLNPPETPEQVIDISDIREARAELLRVDVPAPVIEALYNIKTTLREKGIRPSDRRWKLCRDIIQAEAWFNGRDQAIIADLHPLQFVLWEDPSATHRNAVTTAVLTVADPIEAKKREIRGLLQTARDEYRREIQNGDLSANESGGIRETFVGNITKARRDLDGLIVEATARECAEALVPLRKFVNECIREAAGMASAGGVE